MMSTVDDQMKVDPARASTLIAALHSVSTRINQASQGRKVRLVAVSKLKPASDILALYTGSQQRHFGENYVQELTEKAEVLPRDIEWHFIGGLQSNKCKPLASQIPNLFCVSSVDTIKKAAQLNAGRAVLLQSHPSITSPLYIHIQINTSGEDSKSGVAPGDPATELARHILTSCPHLQLMGLMTIGDIGRSHATGLGEENKDFKLLTEESDRLETELEGGLQGRKLELSMGMSEDFEGAIGMGSGEVRVGSTIFGARPPKREVVQG